MKLLLVSANDLTFERLSSLKAEDFELIWYRNALKAMDNVDEADPAGIIISAQDFPRHWKTVVQFVRAERSRDKCPIALLTGAGFDGEESRKAEHLGVSGLVNETLDAAELARLRDILGGLSTNSAEKTPETESADEPDIKPGRRFGFLFTHPVSEKIITGAVTDINADGFVMEVDRPVLISGLITGEKIPGCSFRAGEKILSPACFIRRTGNDGLIYMEFSSFPENEKAVFKDWLESGA
jgi:hypothetical protein